MAKLTVEQRIEKAHVSLMRNPKFCLFSGLFMVGKVTIDDTMPTAATDGVNVIYGRGFIERLDDRQLAFLILHEAMHKAYRHLTTWEKLFKKNAGLANVACDYVINLQIVDYDPDEQFLRFPTDENGQRLGLHDERFRGMDVAQVYALLEKEAKDKGGSGSSSKGDGSPNNTAEHGNVRGFDEHMWEEAGEMSEQEAEEIAKEIDSALRQGALLASKMSGKAVSREIQDLLAPKVDWREALRDYIKAIARGRDDSSWRRFNSRLMGSDIYMPITTSRRLDCVGVGIDTSGSIGGEILTEFLSEVKSICEEVNPQKVELLYWDTRVAGHETYEEGAVENIVQSTKPRGGGGTAPECVTDYMKDKNLKPDCFIMLTDGCFYDSKEGDWDSVGSPVLWCIKDNKYFVPKNGKAIYL